MYLTDHQFVGAREYCEHIIGTGSGGGLLDAVTCDLTRAVHPGPNPGPGPGPVPVLDNRRKVTATMDQLDADIKMLESIEDACTKAHPFVKHYFERESDTKTLNALSHYHGRISAALNEAYAKRARLAREKTA